MKNVLIIMQFINTKFNRNILKITPNFFLLKQDEIYSFLVNNPKNIPIKVLLSFCKELIYFIDSKSFLLTLSDSSVSKCPFELNISLIFFLSIDFAPDLLLLSFLLLYFSSVFIFISLFWLFFGLSHLIKTLPNTR